jgi:potassium-dependent mechanosensitive channel
MPSRAEPIRGRVAAVLAAVLLLASLAGAALAQSPAEIDAERAKRWDAVASRAETLVNDPETQTEVLETLREELVAQRSDALAAEQERKPPVDELNKRMAALGPPPVEGAEEAPEIAALRRDLTEQIAEAQGPVLTAQEAYRRTDTLIGAIDRTVRARFSAELMSRGPSPLRPATWLAAIEETLARIQDYRSALRAEFADPVKRERELRRVPINLLLIAAGLWLAFMVRGWLVDWVERRLAASPSRRSAALLVALRNLTRLVVPAVGAGLFFAAFDRAGLFARADAGRFFALPPFVIVLIASGWIAGSLLAPKQRAYRPMPLDDHAAHMAHRLVLYLGGVLSLSYVVASLTVHWSFSTATQSALQFPLVVIGAVGLWRVAARLDEARAHIAEDADSATTLIVRRALRAIARLLRLIAIAAPVLGALGYMPAAGFLVLRSILMLGLLAGSFIVFDLLNKLAQSALAGPATQQRPDDGGLVPVFVAAIVVVAALPLFAIIWGARPSDIADFWTLLREGVTLGGIRLSASTVVTLIVVFGLGIGVVRLLQTVLRGTVLPRTRLDAGSKNAVLAGVGYIGMAIAGLIAVAAAGLNLSSLAIVAGALSVGIGFGLQNIVSNFVSGIILLVERPVKEGDWIEVGGFSGYVKGINVRSTEIETFDRASVILPNSDLIAGTVLNRTHTGLAGRLQLPISVTYDADPKRVEAILMEIAEGHPLVLQEPAPRVLFMDLGPDSMNFELRCWLRDVNFSLSVRSDMNFEVVERFHREGIRIPFYGRDLPPGPAPPEPAEQQPAPPAAMQQPAPPPPVVLPQARKES